MNGMDPSGLRSNSSMHVARWKPPPLGSAVKFVGMKGTMTAKVVGYLDDAKLPMGWPGVLHLEMK